MSNPKVSVATIAGPLKVIQVILPDYDTSDRKPRSLEEVREYFGNLSYEAVRLDVDLVAVPWGWLTDALRHIKA
jgi:hypothetical protein